MERKLEDQDIWELCEEIEKVTYKIKKKFLEQEKRGLE